MLSTACPSRLLRRLLGGADDDRASSAIESSRPPVSSERSRAEQARRDARHWLAMREQEFNRRLRERDAADEPSERAS